MKSVVKNNGWYVPTIEMGMTYDGDHNQYNIEQLHHTLLGDDQLTASCARVRQKIQKRCITPRQRLEGLILVIENWHAKGCFLK